jgi:hypothetical protein
MGWMPKFQLRVRMGMDRVVNWDLTPIHANSCESIHRVVIAHIDENDLLVLNDQL